jgi:glycosyltransferase involved in cell wall biosynthesis
MNNPKLTVTIIAYNHENFIAKAVESVVSQKTNFSFEVLIADDFSTDNTRAILEDCKQKYPDKITLLFNSENLGNTKTHLEACKKAKGQYICNLEGDDFWCDDLKLQKQSDFLDNNLQYLGVAHRLWLGEEKTKTSVGKKCYGRFVLSDFLNQKRFSCTSTMYRNFYFDIDESYEKLYQTDRIVGDYILCLYLLSKGDIYVMQDVMSVYRIGALNPTNYNSTVKLGEKMKTALKLRLTMYEYFEKKHRFCKEFIEPLMTLWFLSKTGGQKDLFSNALQQVPKKSVCYLKRNFMFNLIAYGFRYLKRKLKRG